MKKTTLAALLAAPLAVLALGGMYHRGNKLTIEFPDGWSKPTTDKEGIITTKGPGGVLCNAQTNEPAGMKDLTLDQINSEFNHVFNAVDWGNIMSIDPANIAVSEGQKRPFGDAYYQIATLTLKPGTFGSNEVMMRFGAYVLPGRITMSGCYARSADFANWRPIFEQSVSSLRPW